MYPYSVFSLMAVASIASAEELSSVRRTAVFGQNTLAIEFLLSPWSSRAFSSASPTATITTVATSTITVVETETITVTDSASAKRSPAPEPKVEYVNTTTCPPGFSPRPCKFAGCDTIKNTKTEVTPTLYPGTSNDYYRSMYTSLITVYDPHYPEPTNTATVESKRNPVHSQERKRSQEEEHPHITGR